MNQVIIYPAKIYLSGKITGLHKNEYEKNFRFATWELQKKHGHNNVVIINPLEIKPFLGLKNWYCYMISDLLALYKCDTIYLLNNWEDSRGAKLEYRFAKKFKKRIIFQ